MKIGDITEAPLNQEQERELVSRVKKHEEEHGDWPEGRHIAQMIREIEPSARMIGDGMFGQVYGKPRGKSVVKLAEDSPDALIYLKWCLGHQSNPHVPRIYSIFTPEHQGTIPYRETQFYVRMEVLQTLDPMRYRWQRKHLPFLVLLNEYSGVPPVYFAVALGVPMEEAVEANSENSLALIFDRFGGYRAVQDKALKKAKTDPLCQPLLAADKISGGSIDVEIGWDAVETNNIMVRPKTEELVITDPVVD